MNVIFALCFLLLSFSSFAEKDCAKNFSSFKLLIKDPEFPMNWIETTANDGKPLRVDISEKADMLHLEFNKTKEGLWAAGTADICQVDGVLKASISKEQINLGDAAPWILRMSMKGGADFKLEKTKPGVLKISTFGWSGEFVPNKPL